MTKARAYYNEFDPFAAAWLRELIFFDYIANGDVDERSIEDVTPDDLRGYTQCHFFAGIGVWSYALRNAGWADDRPVWTGSCPCQPFSAAGKGGGFDDERHLWPAFFHLIQQCDPAIVIGEQVASKDGLAWLDLVRADVEGTGRAFAAADLCVAGVGAPHIRQRTYWMALANRDRQSPRRLPIRSRGQDESSALAAGHGEADRLADSDSRGCGRIADGEGRVDHRNARERDEGDGRAQHGGEARQHGSASPTNGFWRDADWLYCRDGKWRPVEPGTFPLAHGATNRVGRLRGYGNAIAAPVAQTFIESVMDVLP